MRPRLGLRPTRPHQPAGRRTEPPMSVPTMQWAVAGRTGGARAGAQAAGVLRQVPGIARQRMEARHARRRHAVVRHRGLGEDDRAGLAQARARRRILRGGDERHRGRAERDRHALGGDVLLHGHRHAVERPDRFALRPALRRGGLAPRAVRIVGIERVEMRLPARHVLLDRGEDFRRRQCLPDKPAATRRPKASEVLSWGHRLAGWAA